MFKDILICTFVVAAGFILELRFEKKVDHDEQWKQQMSQDIKDIKTSTKQLADEFNGIKVDTCDMYLISGYGRELVSLTASSSFDHSHGPNMGFLNTEHGPGSWSAKINDRNQYLQVELPFLSRIVGIATQRRHSTRYPQWVTSYRVYYSTDCNRWELIGGGNGKEFIGNIAGDNIKRNYFTEPVKAKCIRVNPLTWQLHVSMRMDVIGCRI